MYRSVKLVTALLCALGLSQASARAGTFTANFNDGLVPNGMTLAAGTGAKIVATGGVGGTGFLVLTEAVGSTNGTVAIADLDTNEIVGGFRFSTKIRIGSGSGRPADGFSVSFGTDVNDTGGGEEGSGTGLRVILDTYDNGSGEAPAIDLSWGGTIFAHTLWAGATAVPIQQLIDPRTGQPASLQTGTNFVDLVIDLKPTGLIDVSYNGITVYTNLTIPNYTPTAGHFVLSARTGGEFETHYLDDISITTVPPITGPATIATQPASTSGAEGGSAFFTVVPGGEPPHSFQWYTNNVPVDGAVGQSLTLTGLTMDLNNLKVKVNVANLVANVDSQEATLTVNPDIVKPTVVRAIANDSLTDFILTFSEDLDPVSAANKDNYVVNGLATTSATLFGTRTVKLVTAPQTAGTSYTVTINGVKDLAFTPNTIQTDTVALVSAYANLVGGLRMDVFRLPELANAGDVASLVSSEKFVNNMPDLTFYVRSSSSRPVYGGGTIDQYGGRLSGWIKPTETADYHLFIRTDDLGELLLSTDDSPANKVSIATVGTCCQPFHEPDTGTTDVSTAIRLEQGRRYYVEALWKEGGGGDYIDVAWRKVGDTTPASALQPIPSTVLETLGSPATALTPPTISFTAPADGASFETNVPVVLTVNAAAAVGKTITRVEFFELNNLRGTVTTPPYTLTLTNLSEDAHKFFARATDSGGLVTDTPQITVSVGGVKKQVKLLAIDDITSWKYDRSGSDLGTAWREEIYDDSAWPSGKALIADEGTTTVEPIRTAISRFNDAGAYVRTFYFRSHFTFTNQINSGVKLALRHVVDDGVVIYLNGHEIHRFGIADGVEVNYLTDFSGHENAYVGPLDIPTTWLKNGDNVIAAEVHQSGGSSSDMVFGLELSATISAVTETFFAIDNVTTWKYDRSGSNLGTAWREDPYDDVLWPSGKALIADEGTTTVEPIRTAISRFNDAGAYVRTFYFRTHFNFAGETETAKLKLRHVVDDGAVFYLNGHEINRFGIADGVEVNYLTDFGGHENAYVGPIDIPSTWLKNGENLFAVEVHQSGGTSSDMVFGAEFSGTFFPTGTVVAPPTRPTITITKGATGISISWVEGGKLQQADAVTGPYADITPDASNPYVIASPTGAKFFRVVK